MKLFLFLTAACFISTTLFALNSSEIKEELIQAIHNADVQRVEYLIPDYLNVSEKEKDFTEINSIIEQLIFESSDEPHFLTMENGVKAVVALTAAAGATWISYVAYDSLLQSKNSPRPLFDKIKWEGVTFTFSALLLAFGIEKAIQIGLHSTHYQRHANLLAIKEILRRAKTVLK